jgi:DNA-binding transcriptional ArsR family regulator
MNKKIKIDEMMVIEDLEIMKVISDPLRLQLIELIGETNREGRLCTVKTLAGQLDMPATKLYYHVNLLEKHGLIKVAETEVVSGIVEKRYQVSARRISVAANILEKAGLSDDEELGMALKSLATILDGTMADLRRSLHYALEKEKQDYYEEAEIHVQKTAVRLTYEQAKALRNEFDELVAKYKHLEQDESEEPVMFGLTIVFFPKFHLKQFE